MNKQNIIHKVIELFSKEKESKGSITEFHNWLIDKKDEDEKEKALFQLWNEPNNISKEESQIAFSLFEERSHSDRKKNNRVILWRYAAAIVALICVTTAYIFTKDTNSSIVFVEDYSPIGETRTIKLPDGSIVETNSSSILVYPEDFGKKSRTVYLSGEANFQVVKNKKIPFIVKSKNFEVTALGTIFNVSSYPEDNFYKATLIEGSIKVTNSDLNIESILNVEEQFAFNKDTNKLLIEKTDIEDVVAWQRGELVFRGVTISEIVKVLQRKYGVIIHNNSKNTDIYNFKFQKDASLEKVLEVIDNVADNFSYKLTDDICYIH